MPESVYRGVEALLESQPEYRGGEGEWEVIVKYHGSLAEVEAALEARAELLGDSFAILTLKAGRIPLLYNYSEIEYVELPKTLTFSLQSELAASCVTQVQGAGSYALRGKGVLVGIIDSGIDYTHPDFQDDDGNSRILYFWDQSGKGPGTPPEGFREGVEYTSAQFTQALRSGRPLDVIPLLDDIGHGTAVAGIAAGNGRASGGAQKGAAPEASIIAVRIGEQGRRSFARTTEIMRAFQYISNRALALEMPVAINLSFGTNNGSHSGSSLFETYIDAVAQRWKTVIAVATGNEGFAGHHYMGQLESGRTLNVEFVVGAQLHSLYLTLWKSFADTFDIELITPGGYSSGLLSRAQPFTRVMLEGARVAVAYGQPSFYDANQEVFIEIMRTPQPIPQGIWVLRVTGRQITEGTFHIWLPTTEEVGAESAFSSPEPELTITLPATAQNVISVGGYDALVGSAASFSGRGYTYRDVYVKPDLVAPAVNILTARPRGGYDTLSGTSMAAPFVTGAAALMMEWGIVLGHDNFLYGQRVKAYLQRAASRPQDMDYPNPVWGYGALCLKNAMDSLVEFQ